MNIISNNCAGGFFFRRSNQPFNNPFIWSLVFPADMLTLIQEYDAIKFSNIRPCLMIDSPDVKKVYKQPDPSIMGINIDGRITVYYTHVFFDEHALAPVRRKSTNGYSTFSSHSYKDVWEAYIKRTNRMLASNEPPCFLINTYDRYGWTYSDVKSIIDCPTKYKIYMVTKYNIDTTNPLIKCIVIPNLNTGRLSNPDNIVADYFDDISNHFTL